MIFMLASGAGDQVHEAVTGTLRCVAVQPRATELFMLDCTEQPVKSRRKELSRPDLFRTSSVFAKRCSISA